MTEKNSILPRRKYERISKLKSSPSPSPSPSSSSSACSKELHRSMLVDVRQILSRKETKLVDTLRVFHPEFMERFVWLLAKITLFVFVVAFCVTVIWMTPIWLSHSKWGTQTIGLVINKEYHIHTTVHVDRVEFSWLGPQHIYLSMSNQHMFVEFYHQSTLFQFIYDIYTF